MKIKDKIIKMIKVTTEDLMEFFMKAKHPVTKGMLARNLDLKGNDKVFLKKAIKKLLNEGKIVAVASGKWIVADNLDRKNVDKIVKKQNLERNGNSPKGNCNNKVFNNSNDFDTQKDDKQSQSSATIKIISINDYDDYEIKLINYISKEVKLQFASKEQWVWFHCLNAGQIVECKILVEDTDSIVLEPINVKKSVFQNYVAIVSKYRAKISLKPLSFKINIPDKVGVTSLELNEGDLVLVAPQDKHGRVVKILKKVAAIDERFKLSEIAIAEYGILTEFDDKALEEAKKAEAIVISTNRVDMHDVPFMTVDGADAKDFDDAIYTEKRIDSNGDTIGWKLFIAIADVAHYVTEDSSLDKDAFVRGNSVYFADRVIPMLPEELSNGWCSLKPDEDRGTIVCIADIDKKGTIVDYKFVRAVIRSCKRLTYDTMQEIIDNPRKDLDSVVSFKVDTLVYQLHDAWKVLNRERIKRGTIELDVKEYSIVFDKNNKVVNVKAREQLIAHKIIEDFMITANVCAAKVLEDKRYHLDEKIMYRVHDLPKSDKIYGLNNFLNNFGLKFSLTSPKPKDFAKIIEQFKDKKEEGIISEAILRSLSQASYSPENLGHYGLALEKYCHFTSPIRRYSDLLVHRAIITACDLGEDGLNKANYNFREIGSNISDRERVTTKAQRDTLARYTICFINQQDDKNVAGIISGIVKDIIFIKIPQYCVEGVIPRSVLPNDINIDFDRQMIVCKKTKQKWYCGSHIKVEIIETDILRMNVLLRWRETDYKSKSCGKFVQSSEGRKGSRGKTRKDKKSAPANNRLKTKARHR